MRSTSVAVKGGRHAVTLASGRLCMRWAPTPVLQRRHLKQACKTLRTAARPRKIQKLLRVQFNTCDVPLLPSLSWYRRINISATGCFAVIVWLESMTRVTIFGDSYSIRVTFKKMVTRLYLSHVFHRMTRLKSQSMTRVRVILQNLWVPDGQTQFVCTQRNEDILLQWWSRLEEIFCVDCLVVLCCILKIKCPQLA